MTLYSKDCLSCLSSDERTSLRKICSEPDVGDIPVSHAEKLMRLGLAELNGGSLEPRGASRLIARAMNRA